MSPTASAPTTSPPTPFTSISTSRTTTAPSPSTPRPSPTSPAWSQSSKPRTSTSSSSPTSTSPTCPTADTRPTTPASPAITSSIIPTELSTPAWYGPAPPSSLTSRSSNPASGSAPFIATSTRWAWPALGRHQRALHLQFPDRPCPRRRPSHRRPGFITRTATHAEIHDVYGMENSPRHLRGPAYAEPQPPPVRPHPRHLRRRPALRRHLDR